MHTLEATGGLTYARWAASVRVEAGRSGGHERRRPPPRRTRAASPVERRPEHLGDGDRAHDRAQRELHGRALSVFGLVVGVALLLTGIGLVILAFAVFGREPADGDRKAPITSQAVTG